MKITSESRYCPTCAAPSSLIRTFSRSREYRCEGGQNCGYFTITYRSVIRADRAKGKKMRRDGE